MMNVIILELYLIHYPIVLLLAILITLKLSYKMMMVSNVIILFCIVFIIYMCTFPILRSSQFVRFYFHLLLYYYVTPQLKPLSLTLYTELNKNLAAFRFKQKLCKTKGEKTVFEMSYELSIHIPMQHLNVALPSVLTTHYWIPQEWITVTSDL